MKRWTLLILSLLFLPFPLISQDVDEMFHMSLEDLMKVEITAAGKYLESMDEIPASAVIITREDIRRYGYRNLNEILENVPGLFSIDDWAYFGPHQGVRGFYDAYNRNIIFLVNNVRQSEFLFGGSHLPFMNIPAEAIVRIEIVRGPMSVIYGTGAFFGVINIVTNESDASPSSSLVAAGVGTNRTAKALFKISRKEGGLHLNATAAIFDTDGPDIPYSKLGESLRPGRTRGIQEEQNRYFHIAGSSGAFNANISYNETGCSKPIFTQPDNDYDGYILARMFRAAFDYTHVFSPDFSLRGKLQYNLFNNEMDYDMSVQENAWEVERYNTRTLDLELTSQISPGERTDIIAGVNYHAVYDATMHTDAPYFGFIRSKTHTNREPIISNSVFAQVKYRLAPPLLLVTGLRVDQQHAFNVYFQNNSHMQYIDPDNLLGYKPYENKRLQDRDEYLIIPQAALIWKPHEKHLIKLLYGEALNRSNFFMHYNMARNPESPLLKPEWIQTLEINAVSMLSPHLTTRISLFYNDLHDLILRVAGLNSQGEYDTYHTNLGKMRTVGFEGQVEASLSSRWVLDAALTYQPTTDHHYHDQDVAYSPDWLGYFKTAYQMSPNISLGITANYVGRMLPALSDPTAPGEKIVTRIGKPVAGYLNLGANLRINPFFSDAFYFNLRVSNLMDTDIYYPVSTYSTWTQKGTMGPGRSFLLTIGWQK